MFNFVLKFKITWSINWTPSLCSWNPEKLVGREIQSGKLFLNAIVLNELFISQISFLDAAIVGDVLALRVDAVEIELHVWFGKVAVLLDDAASFFEVSFFGVFFPPVNEIAVRVKLTSLVIESLKNRIIKNMSKNIKI